MAVSGTASTDYDLSVYGPNGFSRSFKGGATGGPRANLQGPGKLRRARQRTHADCYQHVRADCHSACCRSVHRPWDAAGAEAGDARPGLGRSPASSGWYDFAVTVGSDPGLSFSWPDIEDGQGQHSAIRRWVVCGCGTSRRVRSPLARLQPLEGVALLLMKAAQNIADQPFDRMVARLL